MKSPLLAPRLTFCVAALAVTLAGCGSTAISDKDSPEKLYADARDEMASGGYDKAIKLLERVEGRAAGTLLVPCGADLLAALGGDRRHVTVARATTSPAASRISA